MTAVEWLVEQIFNDVDLKDSILKLAIQQAKEMEKQQIIESYCQGCFDITQDEYIFPRETSEDYYNETFKSE
jgi:hypothetical protein